MFAQDGRNARRLQPKVRLRVEGDRYVAVKKKEGDLSAFYLVVLGVGLTDLAEIPTDLNTAALCAVDTVRGVDGAARKQTLAGVEGSGDDGARRGAETETGQQPRRQETERLRQHVSR